MSHEIGHLPFHTEITNYLKYGKENRVTVACDNTLLADTIPQGKVGELDTYVLKFTIIPMVINQPIYSGRLIQTYTFDFFNYAGIHRPVKLYTTPKSYIDDISVESFIRDNKGKLNISLTSFLL